MNVTTDNGVNIDEGELMILINKLEKKVNEIKIKLNRINLESAHKIIRHIPYTKPFQSIIQQLSPSGQFKDLKLSWKDTNLKFPQITMKSSTIKCKC